MNDYKEKVMILLSTYNGSEYLREQLDSLLDQDYGHIEILIRDDGSVDDTVSILQEYSDTYSSISYYEGENLGPIGSFFDLMEHIKGQNFGYVALCDQDDVWKKNKIRRAVYCMEKLQKNKANSKQFTEEEKEMDSVPLLYCGKPQLVDDELNELEDKIRKTMRPGFANALIENIVTGCTAVMNRSLYDIAVEYMPEYCIMHDWWLYLIATCFGHVIYDPKSYILYRQHGDNVMGLERSRMHEIKSRAKKFKSRKKNISEQAAELVRLLEEKNELVRSAIDMMKDSVEEQEIQTENNSKQDVAEDSEQVASVTNINVLEIPSGKEDKIVECYKRAYLLANYKKGKNRFELAFKKKVYRQRFGDHMTFKLLFILGLR